MICDARHDSTSNAYHTTVPCISGDTHKIVGVQSLSRETHRVAQTREVDATILVLDTVKNRGEFNLHVCNHVNVHMSSTITMCNMHIHVY